MIGAPAAPAASITNPPRILHCHSTFSAGGKEVRCARMINAWGYLLDHTIVSGLPSAMGARTLIDPALTVAYPDDFPALTGRPSLARMVDIAKALRGFDLICTYNWGAMDVVMAHRLFARAMGLAPLVHHEDGFNEDEARALKPARNWYRRAALTGANCVVVPSTGLEAIARDIWHVPRARLQRIANGIDTAAFAAPPRPGGLPLEKPAGQRWIGTLAGLRAVKQLPLLVQAFAAAQPSLAEDWHLVIVGEGPERERILAAATALGMAGRVHLPGAVADPASIIGLFDIFALSSQSEQFPLSVAEAMAARLPVAAPDVGDLRAMVAEPNRAHITPPGDAAALGQALVQLATRPDLRNQIGAANQARARAEFDFSAMLARYRAVYTGALGAAF